MSKSNNKKVRVFTLCILLVFISIVVLLYNKSEKYAKNIVLSNNEKVRVFIFDKSIEGEIISFSDKDVTIKITVPKKTVMKIKQ